MRFKCVYLTRLLSTIWMFFFCFYYFYQSLWLLCIPAGEWWAHNVHLTHCSHAKQLATVILFNVFQRGSEMKWKKIGRKDFRLPWYIVGAWIAARVPLTYVWVNKMVSNALLLNHLQFTTSPASRIWNYLPLRLSLSRMVAFKWSFELKWTRKTMFQSEFHSSDLYANGEPVTSAANVTRNWKMNELVNQN